MDSKTPKIGDTVYAPIIRKIIGLGIDKGLTALGALLVAKGLTTDVSWMQLAPGIAAILLALSLQGYDLLTQMAMTRVAQQMAVVKFSEVKAEAKELSVGDKLGLITTQG